MLRVLERCDGWKRLMIGILGWGGGGDETDL